MGREFKFVDINEFRERAKSNDVTDLALRKGFVAEVKEEADQGNRILQFTISSGDVDRDGDKIDPTGWKFDSWAANPVVLWAHDYHSLPLAKGLAVWTEGDKVKSRAEFAPRELNPFADTVFQMLKSGYLNAVSVGFLPSKWSFADDNERKYGINFESQELLEWSVVPVPSLRQALIDARSKGIDTTPLKEWAEKVLDEWHQEKGLWLPRSKVEQVFALLDSKKSFLVPDTPGKDAGGNTVEKGAISYNSAHPDGTPKAPEDEEWDGSAEVAAADVDDLKVMCAWVDSENADKKGAYKLPHHKAAGQHAVVWRGVAAAGAALMGARGGVNIPEGDVAGVKAHLAKHYREFDKTPPWESEEGRAFEAIARLDIPQAIKEDIGRVLLPGLFDGVKSGRVLSRANEDRIRKAAEGAETVRGLLQEVLAQLEEEPEQDSPASVAHKNQPSEEPLYFELADSEPTDEPQTNLDVDPEMLKEMVRSAVAESLRAITGRVD